jgi:hypothetical protein
MHRRLIHITTILVLVLLSMKVCQRVPIPRVTFALALYETRLLYPSHIVSIAYKQQNSAFLLTNRSLITITLTNSPEH